MANATYALNFRDSSGLTHRTANRFVFDAASDGDAGDVYSAFKAGLALERASMVKYAIFNDEGTTHSAGSRTSLLAYLVDADGVTQKVMLRNIKDDALEADIRAAFTATGVHVLGGGQVVRANISLRTLPGTEA